MRTSSLSRALLACLVFSLPLAWAPSSPAQGRAATARKAPKLDLKALETQLKSKDAGEIRAGLAAVKEAGPSAAALASAVEARLRDGLPNDLATEAMQTLAAVGAESSSKVLGAYARHQDAKLRREAGRALLRTKGAEAIKALRRLLSDADPGVRGVAASGLGNLGAKQMVPDLFIALEHKVAEAGGAVGQLCNPTQCEQLLDKIGKLPFDILSPGFDQILFRPTAEVSDELKIKIVGRVREMGTMEANRLLKDVQGRWPAKGSKKVKQAIDQGVLATEGAAGAKPEGAAQ